MACTLLRHIFTWTSYIHIPPPPSPLPPPLWHHKTRSRGSLIFISNNVEYFNLKIVPGFITFVQEMKILSRDRFHPATYHTKRLAFFWVKKCNSETLWKDHSVIFNIPRCLFGTSLIALYLTTETTAQTKNPRLMESSINITHLFPQEACKFHHHNHHCHRYLRRLEYEK